MNILPIRLVSDTERQCFGENIFNLAKLTRVSFPVAPGIAIQPPETPSALEKLSLPGELERELSNQKIFYFDGEMFTDKKALWLAILQSWNKNLSPRSILFLDRKFVEVCCHFDPDLKEVIIEQIPGKGERLSPPLLKSIELLVLKANKKLFFPQNFKLAVSGDKLVIIGISPFTHSKLPEKGSNDTLVSQPKIVLPEKKIESAVKVFLNTTTDFKIAGGVSGFIIDGERMSDLEETILKIVTAAEEPEKAVIYKLPNISNQEVTGALRLINQKNLLDLCCRAFLFVRHKKGFSNVDMALPLVRSTEELLQIKRELAARGINRKGLLKIWMEVSTPENVINIDSYYECGFDGVILNLDHLQKLLIGFEKDEKEFYKKESEILINFLTPFFKTLHKKRIPVIASGQLVLYPEVLDFLIAEGVWAISVENSLDGSSLSEHLRWAERRLVAKKFVQP